MKDALFLHRKRPSFCLIQNQGPDGTSDNGSDDKQVIANNGLEGSSTGYKIVVCHPGGNSFTTPAITLSASANVIPGRTYLAMWAYNAEMITATITRNGTDITTGKPEAPVMVGEPNQLIVNFNPVPPDCAVPTYQWTIPGEKIKDFEETVGNPKAKPPTFSTGHKVALPDADLKTVAPSFYWYNGTFAGESQEVQAVVSVDGETYTIKGKCKVYRPKFNSLRGTYTSERPQSYFLGGGVRFGNPGITFNGDVQTPM